MQSNLSAMATIKQSLLADIQPSMIHTNRGGLQQLFHCALVLLKIRYFLLLQVTYQQTTEDTVHRKDLGLAFAILLLTLER